MYIYWHLQLHNKHSFIINIQVLMEKKVLIIGSGLLGCGLKSLFDQKGVSTKITMRRNSTEKSVVMKSLKKTFKEDLITNGGHVCDDIGDYREVVNNFKPDLAIITIPMPTDEQLNYFLGIDNCRKIYISSPASDEAKTNPASQNPYGSIKLSHEKLTNSYGQIALQIGFIPELGEMNGKVIPSGLSMKTMLMCNLRSMTVDNHEVLDWYLKRFDTSSGFTCTPIRNVFDFCYDIVTEQIPYPKELIGRTIAMHSNQIWLRHQIIDGLSNKNFQNLSTLCLETKPVKEFKKAFGDRFNVTHDDVLMAIRDNTKVFQQNRINLMEIVIEYANDEYTKSKL